jgi:hypothetical protein
VALVGAFLLAGWAITRFVVGTLRPPWLLALVVLPIVAWSFVARAEAAAGAALLLAALFSLGSWLCLVGNRR